MGVYINMEMPQSFINVRIYSNGRVISQSFSKFGEQIATAVSVPPHGRLIDADALPWEKQSLLAADEDWALPCSIIENAPTVIETEEGET